MPDGPPPTILVVDDDRSILDVLDTGLRHAGFEVLLARSGTVALELAAEAAIDLMVLDVNLPDLDGFEVCRRIRAGRDDLPVLFLSARDTDDDKLTGFDTGGDDYLTKPFRVRELVARIRAVLKRTQPAEARADGRTVLRAADLELDVERHTVTRDGRAVELTPTEFRLLRYLMHNAGNVVSKDQILDWVWGPFHEGEANRVETTMSYLRKKLGAPDVVQTVRGVGYSLRTPEG